MSSSLKFNQANPNLYHILQLSLLHLDAVAGVAQNRIEFLTHLDRIQIELVAVGKLDDLPLRVVAGFGFGSRPDGRNFGGNSAL